MCPPLVVSSQRGRVFTDTTTRKLTNTSKINSFSRILSEGRRGKASRLIIERWLVGRTVGKRLVARLSGKHVSKQTDKERKV